MSWADFQGLTNIAGVLIGAGSIALAVQIFLTRACGRHHFSARSDTIYVDGKWYTTRYVRDVCTHCGAVVERADEPETVSEVASDDPTP